MFTTYRKILRTRPALPIRSGLRPTPLVLAVALAMASTTALAQTPSGSPTTQVQFTIAAQPLGQALGDWAVQSRSQLIVQPELVAGKMAPAVSGSLAPRQALDRLLGGSGLVAEAQGSAVVVKRAPPPAASESLLPTVTVTAGAESFPGEPMPAYAGGQVARGGRIGMFGDRDIFETPFSITAYTRETIDNQQARTVVEVLRNDPSISIKQNANSGGSDDVFNIRGFLNSSTATLFDGLPGITGRSQVIEGIERIELLKGPTAFVNGSPTFSAGGMVNFVPKRAGDQDLTRLTTRYYADSVFGVHADVGRRFGEDKTFGIRANVALQDGNAPLDEVAKRKQVYDLSLDYRGDRFRVVADLEYNKSQTFNYLGGTGIAAGVPVPAAPKNTNNWAQAWGFDYPFDKKRVHTRAEWDFAPDWTASLAYGRLDQRDGDYIYCGSTIVNPAGDVSYDGDCYRGGTQGDSTSLDARVSGRFRTGFATHRLSVGTTRQVNEYAGPFVLFDIPGQTGSNIYNPVRYARPAIPDVPYLGKNYEERVRTFYVGDEIGLLDDRLLVTLGLRRVEFGFGGFDENTGLRNEPETRKAANTPALGALYKLTPSLAVYGNYAEALEQGSTAPDNASVDNPGQVLSPQKSKQREGGFKFDAGAFALTLAAFQIEKANAVTVDRRFGYFGRQENAGLELSVFGERSRGCVRSWASPSCAPASSARSRPRPRARAPSAPPRCRCSWASRRTSSACSPA